MIGLIATSPTLQTDNKFMALSRIQFIWEDYFLLNQLLSLKQNMEAMRPLRQIFDDMTYAWELLENQVKLEISDNFSGEDISYLLQLYMRGVEKMNSLVDIRQSFFKNRVTSLMSRPSVIRILNKPMNKKNKVQEVQASSPSPRKIDSKKQLQLQEKKKEIEMRLAYGAEQHSPEALKKMMAEHTQKQSIIESRIEKIMDTHEERLAKRIRQRKLRTMTAKSKSDIFMNDSQQVNGLTKKQLMQKKRDEQQFGGLSFPIIEESPKKKDIYKQGRNCKSLESKKTQDIEKDEKQTQKARRISMDFKLLVGPKSKQEQF